jgi:hypothetical protein
MKRLEESANAFRAACLEVSDPDTTVDADGWTVHQVAVHTRDVNKLVYGLRARRTAVEHNPEFPNFDGEAFMAANYRASESLGDLLDDFVQEIQAFVEWLRALPPEAWSRVSHHTTLGTGLTLQSWVEKDLAHIQEHLKTVKDRNTK